jgi:hypothetical protein
MSEIQQAPSVQSQGSADESVVMSGSESITSFDDISAIDPTVKQEKAPKKAAPKKEEIDVAPTTAEAKKIRKILAKMGDQDLELTPDTKIRHKISGEEVDVVLDDVLSEYAGKTDWSRKYTELDKLKKTTEAQQQKIASTDSKFKRFAEIAKENPSNGLEYLLDSYGHNGRDVLKSIHQQWAEKYSEMMELDEGERKAREAEDDREYYKRKLDERVAQEKAETESKQLSQKITELREKHGISHDDFVRTYHELAASPEFKQLQQSNPDFVLGPEHVANYYSIKNFNSKVEQHLIDVGHEAANDLQSVHEQISFISQRFPHMGQKELLAVVKKSFPGKSAKQNPLKELVRPKKETVQQLKSFEPVTFDDI